MTVWSYERYSLNLMRVIKDGQFAGWLEASTRRTTGLHAKRVKCWAGRIDGRDILAPTIPIAKKRIEIDSRV